MKYSTKEYPERYFIGIELEGGIDESTIDLVPPLWNSFREDMKLLYKENLLDKYIGLECFPPDFRETKKFDYFAMVQTKDLVEQDGFVSKKLPAGTYIRFEVSFNNLMQEMHRCYAYVKDHNLKVHMGFDYEDYLSGQDYEHPGDAILHFCMLLEHE